MSGAATAAAADVLGATTGPRRISLSSRSPLGTAPERLGRYFHQIQVIELPGVIVCRHPR